MDADPNDRNRPEDPPPEESQDASGEGGGHPAAENDDREWRFSLEDIENRGADDEDGGNVAGSLTPEGEIEAGEIDLENAAFVLLGVALAVLVVVGFMNILP